MDRKLTQSVMTSSNHTCSTSVLSLWSILARNGSSCGAFKADSSINELNCSLVSFSKSNRFIAALQRFTRVMNSSPSSRLSRKQSYLSAKIERCLVNSSRSFVTDSSYVYSVMSFGRQLFLNSEKASVDSFVARTIAFSLSEMLGAAHCNDNSNRLSQSSKWVALSWSATKTSMSGNRGAELSG